MQPLQLAAATQGARRKHEETVSALLAGGADLNQRDNTGGTVSSAEITSLKNCVLCSRSQRCAQVLHLVANEGHAEMVRFLLEHSSELLQSAPAKALDVGTRNRRGQNATQLAEAKDHTEVVEAIQEHVDAIAASAPPPPLPCRRHAC